MRKMIPVLFGLGAFLLIAGLVAAFYAPGLVKKTPLDVNTTTHLSGEAAKLNTSTGQLETNPIKAESITKTDSKASNDTVAVWTNVTCVVIVKDNPPSCVKGDDPRLLTASTDVFATSRTTALAVNKASSLPADAVDHEGLINKWPFDSAKKTYPYWDGTAGKAVDAKYTGTKTLDGVETYVYKVTIKDADIDIAKGVPGTYDDVKIIYVEPKTGAILNQVDDQQRYLANGSKVLDLKLAFTPEQVKTSAHEAKDNISQLNLILRTVPIVGIVGGIVVLLLGAMLMMRSTNRGNEP